MSSYLRVISMVVIVRGRNYGRTSRFDCYLLLGESVNVVITTPLF